MPTVIESFSPTESLSFTDPGQPETIFGSLSTPIDIMNHIKGEKEKNKTNAHTHTHFNRE